LNGYPGIFPLRAGCLCWTANGRAAIHIDRAHADRYLAFVGFALSFRFLLAIVAFALTVERGITDAHPVAENVAK
jgi:hypothetical protein